ncbi:peptidase MA family metallohydrolase [Corallococcus exiguus]|uniref:peptidase MA family metallohydrolase n=6 Tax=Myxococcaceae TaxID=31 RepID=UPI003DA4B785
MLRLFAFLMMLLASPGVFAQDEGPRGIHATEAVVTDAALVPHARPAIVAGELKTQRFVILHTAKAAGAARALAGQIEGVRDTFGAMLGRDWPGTTEIRLGVGRQEFEALALPGGKPPGWAVALAYPGHQIILLDALSLSDTEGPTTLRHELAHVALGQLAKDWPRWFQEGVAQNLTDERYSVAHYSALFRAVTQERVFHFEDLSDEWPDVPADVEIAYAQSAAFVAFLTGKHGSHAMGLLVDGVRAGEPFEQAFGKAFRTSLLLEEQDWREGLAARYGWLPLTTSSALLWLTASVLCVAAFARRMRQKAARMTELAAEDAAEDAALRLLAAARAAGPLPVDGSEPLSPALPWPEWPGATTPAASPNPSAPSQPEALEGAPEALESGAGHPEGPDGPDMEDEEPEASSGEYELDGEAPSGRPPKPTLH